MAFARIKDGKLKERDYVKFNVGKLDYYPVIKRDWTKVPLEVVHYIEKVNHPDMDVKYEANEEPFKVSVEKDKEADMIINKMIVEGKKTENVTQVKVTPREIKKRGKK